MLPFLFFLSFFPFLSPSLSLSFFFLSPGGGFQLPVSLQRIAPVQRRTETVYCARETRLARPRVDLTDVQGTRHRGTNAREEPRILSSRKERTLEIHGRLVPRDTERFPRRWNNDEHTEKSGLERESKVCEAGFARAGAALLAAARRCSPVLAGARRASSMDRR